MKMKVKMRRLICVLLLSAGLLFVQTPGSIAEEKQPATELIAPEIYSVYKSPDIFGAFIMVIDSKLFSM